MIIDLNNKLSKIIKFANILIYISEQNKYSKVRVNNFKQREA